jgi:hypothetical protein
MRRLLILTMAFCGPRAGAARLHDVTVCSFENPHAARVVSGIFAGIGIGIHWRQDTRCASAPDTIRVSFSYRTPQASYPGALGYALPFEGTLIVVFQDRVRRLVGPRWEQRLLAYVLVHEITHILQGTCRHSGAGIMKARWNSRDRDRILTNQMSFAPQDIELIYRGFKARQGAAAQVGAP